MNQRGFGITGVLIALAITGAVGLAIVDHLTLQRKTQKQENVSIIADKIKRTLTGMVISPAAWQATQTFNPHAFSTAEAGGSSAGNQTRLALYLDPASSTPYYDSTSPSAGFDTHGDPCNTYSAANGSDTCPFHYDVRLKSRVLVNGTYVDTVNFALTYKPTTTTTILNGGRAEYSFDLVRNFDQQSVETSCILIGGHFNLSTGACTTYLTQDSSCASGNRFFLGPSPNSTQAQCASETLNYQSCASSQAMTGFVNGTPTCGTVPGS